MGMDVMDVMDVMEVMDVMDLELMFCKGCGNRNMIWRREECQKSNMCSIRNVVKQVLHIGKVSRLSLRSAFLYCTHQCPIFTTVLLVAKKFKDFINTSAYLDTKPNEDIIDILGFLCFEMVRSLCVAALQVRNQSLGLSKRSKTPADVVPAGENPKDQEGHTEGDAMELSTPKQLDENEEEKPEIEEDGEPYEDQEDEEEANPNEVEIEPEAETETLAFAFPSTPKKKHGRKSGRKALYVNGKLETPVGLPHDEYSLLPSHVMLAYTRMQRNQAERRSGGLRNWGGGKIKIKVGLI